MFLSFVDAPCRGGWQVPMHDGISITYDINSPKQARSEGYTSPLFFVHGFCFRLVVHIHNNIENNTFEIGCDIILKLDCGFEKGASAVHEWRILMGYPGITVTIVSRSRRATCIFNAENRCWSWKKAWTTKTLEDPLIIEVFIPTNVQVEWVSCAQ